MERYLPAAILISLVAIQTLAQFRFWKRYQERYPDRLSGSPYLSGWDGIVPDERQGLWYRISLLFASVEDDHVDRLRRRALLATASTALAAIGLLIWSLVA